VAGWACGSGCLSPAVRMSAKAVGPGHAVSIASAVLVTQAAFSNIRLGQVAWPLMLLVTAAWRADRSGRTVVAGVMLGVAAAWKPFLLVFVPYFIWRREWRTLLAMAAVIGATLVGGLLALGPGAYGSWFAALRIVGWEQHLLNASIRGLLAR